MRKVKAWWQGRKEGRRRRRILRDVGRLSAAWQEYETLMRQQGHGRELKRVRRELIAGRWKMQEWLSQ